MLCLDEISIPKVHHLKPYFSPSCIFDTCRHLGFLLQTWVMDSLQMWWRKLMQSRATLKSGGAGRLLRRNPHLVHLPTLRHLRTRGLQLQKTRGKWWTRCTPANRRRGFQKRPVGAGPVKHPLWLKLRWRMQQPVTVFTIWWKMFRILMAARWSLGWLMKRSAGRKGRWGCHWASFRSNVWPYSR